MNSAPLGKFPQVLPLFNFEGVPRFNLVRQRNGTKFTVKKIKVDKDYSFRDNIASLVLKVLNENL